MLVTQQIIFFYMVTIFDITLNFLGPTQFKKSITSAVSFKYPQNNEWSNFENIDIKIMWQKLNLNFLKYYPI